MNAIDKYVLIVGAGPTGMTAALELARQGIPVRLIEKDAEPASTSRAIGVQARTLELFEQRGLASSMLATGNPGIAGSIYGGGKRVFRLEFRHIDSKYGYMLFISQAETEKVLRDALEKEGVTIEREVEMTGFGQTERADGIHAFLRHKDGNLEDAYCSYLIATEGAHSVARQTLGLSFEGKSLVEAYALGDLYIDGDLADSDFHIFSSGYGFMGLFPMGNRRFRLIASNPISKPTPETAPAIEELQTMYDQRSHIPVRFRDMGWSSWFRINSRMVDTLQVGRVFLGGDSAHIHSPAGAQGMNTGIQDMINLGWKLAMVIKGQADPKLLASYSADRIPAIRNVLTKTEALTSTIGSESPLLRSVFNHIAPWVVSTDLVQENSTQRMSQLSINYRESPLSVSDHRAGGLQAGDRLPDMDVVVFDTQHGGASVAQQATRLFQLMDPRRFTLVYSNLTDSAKTHQEIEARLGQWSELMQGSHVAPAPKESEAFRSRFGTTSSILLVRPDGYIAFTGSERSIPVLEAYCREWLSEQPASVKEGQHA